MKLTKNLSFLLAALSVFSSYPASHLVAAVQDAREASLWGKRRADFVGNRGQFDGPGKFAVSKGGISASFEDRAINLRLANRREQLASLRLMCEGASRRATLAGANARGSCYHYYCGDNPQNGRRTWRRTVWLEGKASLRGSISCLGGSHPLDRFDFFIEPNER
jgi:hypothetical protein